MKKLFMFLIVLVLSVGTGSLWYGPANADEGVDLSWSGFVRVRPEFMMNYTDFLDHGNSEIEDPWTDYDDEGGFVPMKASLALYVTMPRDVYAYLEVQTEYNAYFGDHGSGPSGADTHMYQAYLGANNMWDTGFNWKAGRFEITFGDEFFFGNLDFYDGFTHTAILGSYDFEGTGSIYVFWAKDQEYGPGYGYGPSTWSRADSEDDADLYTIYTTWNVPLESTFDAYLGVYDNNSHSTGLWSGAPPSMFDEMESTFIGLRWARDKEDAGFDWKTELVWQDNEYSETNTSTLAGIFPSESYEGTGWAFDARIGFTFDNAWSPWLALGYTRYNGDDDEYYFDSIEGVWVGSPEHDGYYPFFQDWHNRYGCTDMLGLSGAAYFFTPQFGGWGNMTSFGADIIKLSFAAVVPETNFDWGVNLVWIDAGEVGLIPNADGDIVGADDHVGTEWDIYGNYKYSDNLTFNFAIAYFDTGDFVRDYAKGYFLDTNMDGVIDWLDDEVTFRQAEMTPDDLFRAYINALVTW